MAKKVLYPADKRIELDGGLNNKFERSIIAENESPDCLNVTFSEGSVSTRQGTTSLTVSGVGSYVFDGFFTRNDNTGAETMLAWVNGTMYGLSVNTFVTVPSAQAVYTAAKNVNVAQYENHIFMGNGTENPYKYNGTDFTRHGIYPANSGTTASTAGVGGNLNGDYQWQITYVNSQLVEGDVSPAVATFTTVNEKVTLTAIPTAPQSWGVDARKIYRTAAGGSTFKYVDTISDNTTTDYTDNTADANLGDDAPTDQGVPPDYSIVIYYRDRLFMNDPTNPNYVWYSELGNPYVVKATNFIKIGDNTTDILRAFGLVQNALVCFGDESYTFIYMPDTTPGNWQIVPGDKQYGCKSPRAIFNYQNRLMFPAIQNQKFVGFASLSATGLVPDATYLTVLNAISDLQSNKLEPDMFQIQETYLDNIASITYKNKAYITVTYGSGNTTNNRIYEFDFSISNVSKKQDFTWVPWTGLNAKQFTILDGNLYYADSTANVGHVYKMLHTVYSDNGAAIDSYIWTKELGGGKSDLNYHKDFREAYILAEQTGAWDMNFDIRIDSDATGYDTIAVDLTPGGSTWGAMTWGVDDWGGGVDQKEHSIPLTQKGKRIQFRFTNQNTATQWFKIHGLGFRYNRKGLR